MKSNLFIFICLLSSCASIPPVDSTKKISFTDIEQIKLGETTQTDLEQRFGKPVKIVRINDQLTGVIYDEFNGKEMIQKASFNIENNTKTVSGVLWIPSSSDVLSNIAEAKKYFKNGHFITKVVKRTAVHESFDDVYLMDDSLGISMSVYPSKQRVNSIMVGLPTEHRTPAVSAKITL